MAVLLLFISAACYYFLLPNRDWLGKPYLETAQKDSFAVVELFTSEGCSSCPPADDILAKIQKESVGKNIYLLAYHVDYWDNYGWVDRFSSASFTERQQQYSRWMKHDLIYTPQFVVNGISEFGGDDARALYRLVSKALEKKSVDGLVLAVNVSGDSLQVDYKTDKTSNEKSLLIAVVQKAASTNVERGENSGATLHHVQIVHKAQIVALDKVSGNTVIAKPENFNTKDWQIIGFIQNNVTGEMSAAASADLKN